MNNPFVSYGLVQLRRITGCRGQGALEYIAIAVILVILIIAAFQIIGGQIQDRGNEVGREIQGAACGGDNQPACPNPVVEPN